MRQQVLTALRWSMRTPTRVAHVLRLISRARLSASRLARYFALLGFSTTSSASPAPPPAPPPRPCAGGALDAIAGDIAGESGLFFCPLKSFLPSPNLSEEESLERALAHLVAATLPGLLLR